MSARNHNRPALWYDHQAVNQLSWFEEVCLLRFSSWCALYTRMRAQLPWIKAQLFPGRAVSTGQLARAFAVLIRRGLVCQQNIGGCLYLQPAGLRFDFAPQGTKMKQEGGAALSSPAGKNGQARPPAVSRYSDTLPALARPFAALLLQDGSCYPVYTEQIQVWQAFYPHADVPGEVLRMENWCLCHPSRRKTAALILPFITDWLTRAERSSCQPDR